MSSTHYKTAEDFDWYKFFPASFAMTTTHLSHVELGVYRRILDRYWVCDNTIPKDAAEVSERIGEKIFNWRRYGITAPAGFENEDITIKVVEHLLDEFFEQDEDGNWHHVWLDDYRNATDTEFKARSKTSKERVARQSRGPKGKFGKIITVPDGEVNREPAVPDGEVNREPAVEQSREDGLDQIKVDQNKVEGADQNKVEADVASTLPQESSGTQDEKSPVNPQARLLELENRWSKAPQRTEAEKALKAEYRREYIEYKTSLQKQAA